MGGQGGASAHGSRHHSNPIAGMRKIPGLEKRLEQAFCRHGIPCELLLTEKAGDATDFARQAARARR